MLRFPNAKINIGLNITGKRTDGFHNLETVFFPVTLHDALEILPVADEAIKFSGLSVSGKYMDNIVWKAYKLLACHFPGKIKPLAIYLYKNIPMGAGLGGGSADGAFMIQMINDYFHLALSKDKLISYALELGSDCPFFIENKPCFAMGRGEILKRLNLDLSAYSLHIIYPELHVSTAAAFKTITPKKPDFDLRQIVDLPVKQWKDYIQNDFEQPVFELYPKLREIKQRLYDQGATYAGMSGSGSSIYGIFPKGAPKAVITSSLRIKEFYLDIITPV